ncbi:MAG: exonuclease SbcCD subunit D C-terminal domain-containing protein [Acidobacteria bacterium]|nr:exonuclease SbcCD subunit D C-terminal domain-containing protein [Acidobacteriota bacterium]
MALNILLAFGMIADIFWNGTRLSFRLLHTSDWHLGQQLHHWSRQEEHRAFLNWLAKTLDAEQVDALIVAGDIFDVSNPPASAVHDFFQFLAQIRAAMPHLQVVIIGGNHDSAARLNSSNPVLNPLDIHVIGGIPRTDQGEVDFDRMCIPLHGPEGQIQAWCAAMPFIRMADLGTAALTGGDTAVQGYRDLHRRLVDYIKAKAAGDLPLILTGHAFMRGGLESPDSERRLTAGTLLGLPTEIFPESVDYIALGHLHRPQTVGDQEWIRYSGSPIPLSLAEAGTSQSCTLVSLGDGPIQIQTLEIPRHTQMWRLPEDGPASLETISRTIRKLPTKTEWQGPLPFLELRVLLDQPQPGLHREIQTMLADKAVRLVKISPTYPERTQTETTWSGTRLSELKPTQVLEHFYQQNFERRPDPAVVALFEQLLESCHQEAP